MIKTRKNTDDSDFDAFQHDKVLAGCGAERASRWGPGTRHVVINNDNNNDHTKY